MLYSKLCQRKSILIIIPTALLFLYFYFGTEIYNRICCNKDTQLFKQLNNLQHKTETVLQTTNAIIKSINFNTDSGAYKPYIESVSTTTSDSLVVTPISTTLYKPLDLNQQPSISTPLVLYVTYTTSASLAIQTSSKPINAPTRPTKPAKHPTKPNYSILAELPTQEQLQGVVALTSKYKGSPIRKLSKPRKLKILFYTMVGLTFDEKACGFFSGCSKTYKVCDQNFNSSGCDMRLKGKYTYTSLSNKKKELIETMCERYYEFGKYDLFIKVDDDLMFKPEEITTWAESIDMPSKSFIGYFKMSKDRKAVWPTGAIYMYTKDVLEGLCQNQSVLRHMKGTIEDVHFARAIQLTGNITYFNLDRQINVYHTRYKSDRVYIRYLRKKSK